MLMTELRSALYRLVHNNDDRQKLYHYLKGLGNTSDLHTTNKETIIEALNEVFGYQGNLSELTTEQTETLVAAINNINSNVGNLSGLHTVNKNNTVAAINELLNSIGVLSELETTEKGSLVKAINEIKNYNQNSSYIIIDNTINISNPANKITGFFGKDYDNDIRWIKNNSHLYIGELNENNILQCKQLSDNDKSLYVDGTAAPINTKNVFMKLPEFWWICYETFVGSDCWKFEFSKSKKNNWNHWDGKTFIGVYEAILKDSNGDVINPTEERSFTSGDKLYSISSENPSDDANGVKPVVFYSQSSCKQAARANGQGFQIVTYEAHQIMCLLFYAYYGNTNSQSICGSGSSDYPKVTGKSNSLGMSDTTNTNSGTLKTVNFWGLENWWGDLYEWIDNLITATNHTINLQDSSGTTIRNIDTLSTENGDKCIKQMTFGDNGDVTPKSYDTSDYAKFYADFGYVDGSAGNVAERSGGEAYAFGGVGYLDLSADSGIAAASVGSRLLYKGNYSIIV